MIAVRKISKNQKVVLNVLTLRKLFAFGITFSFQKNFRGLLRAKPLSGTGDWHYESKA